MSACNERERGERERGREREREGERGREREREKEGERERGRVCVHPCTYGMECKNKRERVGGVTQQQIHK